MCVESGGGRRLFGDADCGAQAEAMCLRLPLRLKRMRGSFKTLDAETPLSYAGLTASYAYLAKVAVERC